VSRFVCKLRAKQPERVWHIEVQPGEEVQVDFGVGAPIEIADARPRRSWILRMVLSYSRKGYVKRFTDRTLKHSCDVWKMVYGRLAGSPSC